MMYKDNVFTFLDIKDQNELTKVRKKERMKGAKQRRNETKNHDPYQRAV